MADAPVAYQHLPLLAAEDMRRRRKRTPPGQPALDLATRRAKADELVQGVAVLAAAAAARPPRVVDFDPSLVFRVRLREHASLDELEDALARVGIRLVAREDATGVIAFKDNADLGVFRTAVDRFAAPATGPDGDPRKTTVYDILRFVDAASLARLDRRDRIGDRLRDVIGAAGQSIEPLRLYTVDIDLWHHGGGTPDAVRRLRRQLDESGTASRVCDQYVSGELALMRAKVSGADLAILIDMDLVALVDLPPQPDLVPLLARTATIEDLRIVPPAPDGPRVCVIDSGVNAGHPLLSGFVGHAEAFHTSTTTATDENGHGTSVAGIAVFGDVRECLLAREFASDVTVLSARVLNAQNELDDERLFGTQVRDAVRFFKADPYRCRVFNLSFGSAGPALGGSSSRQALWAAQLDELARSENVLFVVAAGNVPALTTNQAEAEHLLRDYPRYLFADGNGVCDPGTSALAITVGAMAHSDSPAPVVTAVGQDDVRRPIARSGQPSPFTRTGPGCGGAVKPEMAHNGGNLLFSLHRVGMDAGLGVTSLAASGGLFAYDIGTSFAAPAVARIAARAWHALERTHGMEPTPDLVRAILAVSAELPELGEGFGDGYSDECLRSIGYGKPVERIALASHDSDLILATTARVAVDGFLLFEIPVPPAMAQSPGRKEIVCAAAFSPRCNPKRRDYLAAELSLNLFRGADPTEIIARYEAVAGDREARKQAPRALQDRRKCAMAPSITKVDRSTLQRRAFCTVQLREDDGDAYHLMVTCSRNWESPEAYEEFAVAVRLKADCADLYNQVRARIQQRAQARARIR